MTFDELTAIEGIKQLKGRYCRLLDTKDWDGYGNVYARDATLIADTGVSTMGGDPKSIPEIRGRAEIQSGISNMLGNVITVHQCHTPEIALTSPTTATGIWAMEDIVEFPVGALLGRGHYHETYVVEGGKWRIASLHLVRTRIETIPRNSSA